MTDVTIVGRLHQGGEARDAIHIAVAPVIAGGRLYPGERIGFKTPGDTQTVVSSPRRVIGIVDPFLSHYVEEGDQFWLFLTPNTITALRHVWTHPDFEEGVAYKADPASKARRWIEAFGSEYAISYEEMIGAAEQWLRRGDYLNRGGQLEGVRVPDEFWDHYEVVSGETVPEDTRGSFFTCSC